MVVLGATNRPMDLDDAVLRRFPRRLLVDLPTEEGRRLILCKLLRENTLAADVDLVDVAKRTVRYSGSDLRDLCYESALTATKRSGVPSVAWCSCWLWKCFGSAVVRVGSLVASCFNKNVSRPIVCVCGAVCRGLLLFVCGWFNHTPSHTCGIVAD